MQQICLIVPCYNESKRLPQEAVKQALINYPNLFLCFVNDGSTDDTAAFLLHLRDSLPEESADRCWIVSYSQNRGKSGAIQQGLRSMSQQSTTVILNTAEKNLPQTTREDFFYGLKTIQTFDYFGYWDADLATPFTELDWFFHHAKTNEFLLLMGSRVARLGAEIHRTVFRHYSGRLFATLISQGLGWKVHDTQCGAKIFKKPVLDLIIDRPFVTQWLFDVEILLRLKIEFGESVKNQIMEVPLRRWEDIKGSKLGALDFIKVPFQIWKVFNTYKLKSSK